MSTNFRFIISATDGKARQGVISTPRGFIVTPAYMPVGTYGTVKAMYMSQIHEMGIDVILGNSYHLMLRPGAERIARLGGLHDFIRWQKPILTDSGGFQVMSLAKFRKLNESGVTFKSHLDGQKYELTPERCMEIQALLNSDIQMQLDECLRLPASKKEMRQSMERSLRWAERCKKSFLAQPDHHKRAVFGIVQGGDDLNMRIESARALKDLDLEGYSIGGMAVGESQAMMLKIIDTTCLELPSEKPRYLMGIGTPDDLLKSIACGIDMFDCVIPTRAGRHGTAYTRFGKINLRNTRHAEDKRPLDEESKCPATRDYSRAYLHYLVRTNESLGGMLLTWNNLSYYQNLIADARMAIKEGRYSDFMAQASQEWNNGDITP
ncbi:tRNA guanosine(34) transglycosylase Tgt [Candidatus Endowatersipora endosymbiont of Watersipora subatra]|uniref:tRNA guanosine(34) transglycosylase Tgt n=1 Tax=Candidatus Endowatersipora endosymbiont of Watersipora subatra TaxID=3077946 RepID=UPI00312CAC58